MNLKNYDTGARLMEKTIKIELVNETERICGMRHRMDMWYVSLNGYVVCATEVQELGPSMFRQRHSKNLCPDYDSGLLG